MFQAILLVCALGTAPQACDLDHNLRRIPLAAEFDTSIACAIASMQIMAAERIDPAKGYPKVVCTRWEPANRG